MQFTLTSCVLALLSHVQPALLLSLKAGLVINLLVTSLHVCAVTITVMAMNHDVAQIIRFRFIVRVIG